jgi:hypothetical protein
VNSIQLSLNLIEEIKQINKDRMVLALDTVIPYNVYLKYKELTRDSDPDSYDGKEIQRNSISTVEAYKRWYASRTGKLVGALIGLLAGYGLAQDELVDAIAKMLAGGIIGAVGGSQVGHNIMAGRDWSKKEFEKADNLEK